MECTRPQIICDQGKYLPKEKRYLFMGPLLSAAEKAGMTPEQMMRNPHYMRVPCGKCLACKMRKGTEWAARCIQEAEYYEKDTCWFVTLTYAPEHLPFFKDKEKGEIIRGAGPGLPTLYKKDMQDYHKRLRWHLADKAKREDQESQKIKFLMCGEYGSRNGRPHYHEIIFGVPFTDLKYKRISKEGIMAFDSPWLSDIWGHGLVDIEELSLTNAKYVAQYTVKKMYGPEAKKYDDMGIIAPYLEVSNGLGKQYIIDHLEEMKAGNGGILKGKKGVFTAPPSAYAKKIINSTLTEEEKEERRQEAQERQVDRLDGWRRQTTVKYEEQQEINERTLEKRASGQTKRDTI